MKNNDICSIATMARIKHTEVHECAYCRCRVSHPTGTADPNGGRYCHLGWYYCGRCWEMWENWWNQWCRLVWTWASESKRQVNIFRFFANMHVYMLFVCINDIRSMGVLFVFRSCLLYRECCHSGWVWCVGPSDEATTLTIHSGTKQQWRTHHFCASFRKAARLL